MAGGATDVAEEPAETTKPEIQPEPKPTVEPNSGNIDNRVRLQDGRVINRDNLKAGDQIARDGEYFRGSGMQFEKYPGQCTWFSAARVQEITGKKIKFSSEWGNDAKNWTSTITNGTKIDTSFSNGTIIPPKPGDIRVSPANSGNGNYGQVSIVEKVTPITKDGKIVDYKILYSEANWDSDIYNETPATDGVVQEKTLSDFNNNGDTIIRLN